MIEQPFVSAQPVWAKGREREMNVQLGFRAVFDAASAWPVLLRCAAAGPYRVWLNGRFVGAGPARAAHGRYRVDEWALQKHLQNGPNLLALEAVGYNVNGYGILRQPSFLQAEATLRGHVLVSTEGEGARLRCVPLPQRIARVQRFSPQRGFVEAYRLTPRSDLWRRDLEDDSDTAELDVAEDRTCLPRHAPQPNFEYRLPCAHVMRGTAAQQEESGAQLRQHREGAGPFWAGFPKEKLELLVCDELQQWQDVETAHTDEEEDEEAGPFSLAAGQWRLTDFGTNQTGCIGLQVRCHEPVRLHALFDEILVDGDLDFLRNGTIKAVTWFLEPGEYALETIEPYTLRYLKTLCLQGACTVEQVFLRETACPDADSAGFICADADLEEIFEAGRETFRQNAVDLPMNCPSRERAGWLCDSYFTARAEKLLRGTSAIEHDFLHNYLMAGANESLPKGMPPMCYPADHPDGDFRPDRALWLVLQLEDHVARGGDPELAAAFRNKTMDLFGYFKRFVNADGLIEALEGRFFEEGPNPRTPAAGVHYPLNMLYAAALDAAGRLYQDKTLCRQAESVRQAVRDQAFEGRYVAEQAVRGPNGNLVLAPERTETAQYCAFYFSLATPERDPDLWERVMAPLAPDSKQPAGCEDLLPSNMLPGHLLRLEVLSRAGRSRQVAEELKAFFLEMARTTGTLWEYDQPVASCCHGFAAHAVCHLYKDILGVRVAEAKKRIEVRLADLPLRHAMGVVPLAQGAIRVQWEKDEKTVRCRIQSPPEYQVEVVNRTGLRLHTAEE